LGRLVAPFQNGVCRPHNFSKMPTKCT
jgi:hypothetical protein